MPKPGRVEIFDITEQTHKIYLKSHQTLYEVNLDGKVLGWAYQKKDGSFFVGLKLKDSLGLKYDILKSWPNLLQLRKYINALVEAQWQMEQV